MRRASTLRFRRGRSLTDRISLIIHRDKEILRLDFRGLTADDDIIVAYREVHGFIKALGRPTLRLTNVEGVPFSPRTVGRIAGMAKELHRTILKDAVVGVDGMKRILFKSYTAVLKVNARAFSDETAALVWLTE